MPPRLVLLFDASVDRPGAAAALRCGNNAEVPARAASLDPFGGFCFNDLIGFSASHVTRIVLLRAPSGYARDNAGGDGDEGGDEGGEGGL